MFPSKYLEAIALEKITSVSLHGFALDESDGGCEIVNFQVVGVFNKGVVLRRVWGINSKISNWDKLVDFHFYSDPVQENYLSNFRAYTTKQLSPDYCILYGEICEKGYGLEYKNFLPPTELLSKIPKIDHSNKIHYHCKVIDEEGETRCLHFTFLTPVLNGERELLGEASVTHFENARFWGDRSRVLTMNAVSATAEVLANVPFEGTELRKELEPYLIEPDLVFSTTLIENIQVVQKFQGQGYGTRIMQFLQKYLNTDSNVICLLSHSHRGGDFEANNLKLIKWYRSHGFSQVNGTRGMVLTNRSLARAPLGAENLLELRAECAKSTDKYIVIPALFREMQHFGIDVDTFLGDFKKRFKAG